MAVTLNPTAALVIFTMLMCGTINTVDMKAQFDTYAMGDDESMGVHAFRKPWFTVFGMFLSMSMGLVVHFGQQLFYRAKASRSEGNLNHENIENLKECLRESSATETAVKKLGVWGTIWRCSVPALGDLSSSALGSIGLLFINASTYQMLRGASILSTAALSSIVLKKKFTRDQYIALVIVTISLCMIAWVGSDQTSNAGAGNEQGGEDGQKGDNTAIIGVALVLVGQIFVAGQFVWEERVMKVIKVPPMLLLGIEGVFGSLFTYFVIFPALAQVPGNDAFGTFEDFHDSITMLNNSSRLRLLFGGYLLSIVFFNLSSVYCTKVLSGVHRTLVSSGLRTMTIWIVDLVLFYVFTRGAYGEAWQGMASYVQLVGFALFLWGSLMYSQFVTFPRFGREVPESYSPLPGN